MFDLQELRKRAEGFGSTNCYDTVLKNFRCVHKESPPIGEKDYPLLSCAFAKKSNYGHVLSATCDDGRIMVLNTEFLKDDYYPYALEEVSSDALFSVTWSDMDMKLVTTSGSHNAAMFQVKDDGSMTELNIFRAHSFTVKTACFQPNNSDVFATGGRDGMIYIWDARSSRTSANGSILPENCIMNSHCKFGVNIKNSAQKQKSVPSITCLVYQDEYKLISCADSEPCIKMWDLRKNYQFLKKFVPLQELQCPDEKFTQGYSHMVMNRNGSRLFANCFNNTIYCYNTTSYSSNLEFKYTGHECKSFYVKCTLSPDEKYLASTDSANKVYFWRVNASEQPIVMLDGFDNGLSDVSWCPADPLKLATTSDCPCPWIWKALPKNEESDHTKTTDGFGVQLNLPYKKCKKTFSMAPKLRKYTVEPTELSQIVLPNAFVDGVYQTHTCTKIEPKPSSVNNWLTNLHTQQQRESITPKLRSKLSAVRKHLKESISPKSLSKLSLRNRISPKLDKSSGVLNRSKGLKRKRLSLSPKANNLTKYFKHSNENFHNI